MTLLQCLRDPNLFARHFKGESWAAWRVFLAALFAEAPREGDLASFSACTGRSMWPASPFNEGVLIVGRRGGKSRILALIAVFLACFRDYGPFLAPGEVATIAVLAVDRDQARAIALVHGRAAPEGDLLADPSVVVDTERQHRFEPRLV
jgi:hypothetical protein